MTTREIYFKGLYYSDLAYGLMRYFYRDENDGINLGGFIALHYDRDEKIASRNIDKMIETEKTKGFICWKISPEGEKYLEDNWCSLSEDQIESLYKYE